MPTPALCTLDRLESHRQADYDSVRDTAERIARSMRPKGAEIPVAPDADEFERMDSNEACAELARVLSCHPCDTLCAGAEDRAMLRAHLTLVSRKWEEKFMREAEGNERPCAREPTQSCFASLLECNGLRDPTFALVEFYTEQEYAKIDPSSGQWPTASPNLCICCLHSEIAKEYFRSRQSQRNLLARVSVASIGNIAGQPGEYCIENMVVNSPNRHEGLVEPVAFFRPVDFVVTRARGKRYLRHTVPTPAVRSNFC